MSKPTLALLSFLIVGGCADGHRASADHASTRAASSPPVELVSVESRLVEVPIRLDAELLAFESVDVRARVAASVADIPVDRGTVVRRGQLLVRLAAPELVAQRAEAASEKVAAEATFARLRAASETPGAVAGNDLSLAEASVAAQTARVRALDAMIGYLRITAPFDGVVTERNVHPGALVGPSSGEDAPLLRVEQVRRLRAVVAVPERMVGDIVDGGAATIAVRAFPDRRFPATIRRTSHSVDSRTRTMAVELDVDNREGLLAPGMFANVEWPFRRASPSLLVPPSAIVQGMDRTFVIRDHGGVAERVDVERGVVVADRVEVFGRLQPGDRVVRRGSEDLRDGAPIRGVR